MVAMLTHLNGDALAGVIRRMIDYQETGERNFVTLNTPLDDGAINALLELVYNYIDEQKGGGEDEC